MNSNFDLAAVEVAYRALAGPCGPAFRRGRSWYHRWYQLMRPARPKGRSAENPQARLQGKDGVGGGGRELATGGTRRRG